MLKKILSAMLIFAAIFACGCGKDSAAEKPDGKTSDAGDPSGELRITMLNVGQGDAILIQSKSHTTLIDTGDLDERQLLVRELERANVKKIDALILTHPHADHIGGAKILIAPGDKNLKEFPYVKNVSVETVYDNGIESASPVYKNYKKAIDAKKIKHVALSSKDGTIDLGDGVKFEVIYPTPEVVKHVKDGAKSDPNNESVVGRLVYGKFTMMFTGDAEAKVEEYLVKNDSGKLKSDVLKAGHHGSKTSSTKDFLKAVNPEYVFISAGPEEKNRNTYGHPHKEALENFIKQGIAKKNILCTKDNGDLTLKTDGKTFSVTCENDREWIDEWLKKKSKK